MFGSHQVQPPERMCTLAKVGCSDCMYDSVSKRVMGHANTMSTYLRTEEEPTYYDVAPAVRMISLQSQGPVVNNRLTAEPCRITMPVGTS